MWRMGVPVATPVLLSDVVAGAVSLLRPDGQVRGFEKEVGSMFGSSALGLVSSGRSALYVLLCAMKRPSPRDEVIIPAFVCPSVGRAVVKAGLKALACDVNPSGFGLDEKALSNLVGSRTLAVVTTHLFGYATDVTAILKMAHSAGAMLIEDAAQAFGALTSLGQVGSTADAAIFRFGMSKLLPAPAVCLGVAH